MAEPTEAAILQVCEFSSLDPSADRQLVIAALKAHNGNAERALEAYWDDQAKFRQTYTWDESSFLGDRDHARNNPDVPSFTIDSVVDSSQNVIQGINPSHLQKTDNNYDGDYPYLPSVSPTHPPSRASTPVSRNVGGWINETSFGAPSTLAQEDMDLERALAESAAMSGFHTPQESGVTGSSAAAAAAGTGPSEASEANGSAVPRTVPSYPAIGPSNLNANSDTAAAALPSTEQDAAQPYFGPANRATYNTEDWAMTRIEPVSRNVKPSARARAPNAPAFMASPNDDCLNAVLTILHAIPAARNALLRFGGVEAHTYGNNPEWWKGAAAIEPVGALRHGPVEAGATWLNDEDQEVFFPPPAVDRDPDDAGAVAALPLGLNSARQFIEELQRVMAFLDGTDRSYAFTTNLETAYIMSAASGEDAARRFCSTLSYFHLPDFNTTLFTRVEMLRLTDDRAESLTDTFMMLDVDGAYSISPRDSLPATSLYHMLDQVYWTSFGFDIDAGVDVGSAPHVWEIPDYKMAVVTKPAHVQLLRVDTATRRRSYADDPYSLEGLSADAAGLPAPLTAGALPPRIEIPATLYMDRYVEENKDWAVALQDRMRTILAALQRIHALIREISSDSGSVARPHSNAASPDAKASRFQKMAELVMLKLWNYKTKILWERSLARGTDFNSADVDAVAPETPEETRVFARLRAELAVAQKRLQAFRQRAGRLQAERDALWKLLTRLRRQKTVPTEAEPLKYPYRLRGVVISPKRFYICRREPVEVEATAKPEPEPEHTHADDAAATETTTATETMTATETTTETETTTATETTIETKKTAFRDQWWLIIHRDESTLVQKTTLDFARNDAQTPGMNVILAYCTDEAWTTAEAAPLCEALQTFVKHDNRHFKTERETERKQQAVSQESQAQTQTQTQTQTQSVSFNDVVEHAEHAHAEFVEFVEMTKKRQQGTASVDDYGWPLSPLKRRQQQQQQHRQRRSSSIDSMASNGSNRSKRSTVSSIASDAASAGDDVDVDVDVDLSDREMEDMPLLRRQDGTANGGVEETTEKTETEKPVPLSSPLGKEMVDLAISAEAVAPQTETPMTEQPRVPKEAQYPKEKTKRPDGETERQFSTGVQLVADWDNPEGRYVPDEMDES